jgi:hypothetical protein
VQINRLPKDQQAAEWKKFFTTHTGDADRIYLGRSSDKSASLRINDEQGRNRLIIRVDAGGNPVIQFLDEGGKVSNQIRAEN